MISNQPILKLMALLFVVPRAPALLWPIIFGQDAALIMSLYE